MALVAILFVGAGLLGLMFVVLPDFWKILLVIAGFALFFFLHYITWGRWMLRAQQRAEADAEASDDAS
jgi:hypothetical protein